MMNSSITNTLDVAIACLFKWEALSPQDILVMIAILVALFGERLWKLWDGHKKQRMLKMVTSQCLANFKSDLIRIRDNRNDSLNSKQTSDKQHVDFSHTSKSEIGHYYDLFIDLIVPNIVTLRLPKNSKTIEFFDNYKKNLEKIKAEEYLELGTVNRLLDRVDEALNELSAKLNC